MFFVDNRELNANIRLRALCVITMFTIGCVVDNGTGGGYVPSRAPSCDNALSAKPDLSGIWTIEGNGTRTNCGDVVDEDAPDTVDDLTIGPMAVPIKHDMGHFSLDENEWQGDESNIRIEGEHDSTCGELEFLTVTEYGEAYGELVLHDAIIDLSGKNPRITGKFRLYRATASESNRNSPLGCKQGGNFFATIKPFRDGVGGN